MLRVGSCLILFRIGFEMGFIGRGETLLQNAFLSAMILMGKGER